MILFDRQKMYVIQRTVEVDANANHFLEQKNMLAIAITKVSELNISLFWAVAMTSNSQCLLLFEAQFKDNTIHSVAVPTVSNV